MVSRTFEGKHKTRFIIEIKDANGKYFRSHQLHQFYPTREEAQAVIDFEFTDPETVFMA